MAVSARQSSRKNPSPDRTNPSLAKRIVSQSTSNRKHWLTVGSTPLSVLDNTFSKYHFLVGVPYLDPDDQLSD